MFRNPILFAVILGLVLFSLVAMAAFGLAEIIADFFEDTFRGTQSKERRQWRKQQRQARAAVHSRH